MPCLLLADMTQIIKSLAAFQSHRQNAADHGVITREMHQDIVLRPSGHQAFLAVLLLHQDRQNLSLEAADSLLTCLSEI